MAKRSNNNSAGRRPHDEKPYDPNNSFVKKMATRMGDLIPHQTWISKWFNSPGINGDSFAECEQPDGEEESMIQPPTKRPRIRMDETHPPGTFTIQPRGRLNQLDSNQEKREDNTEGYHDPSSIPGPSSSRSFVASTPAVRENSKPINPSKPITIPHGKNNGTVNGTDEQHSESGDSTSGCSSLITQTSRQQESIEQPNYMNSGFSRKGLLDNKSNSFTNHLQSPRSLFLESITRDSMSTRRPSFNVSLMNNNNDSNASNNVDTNSILSSPFYRGNITFGGANAIERSRKNLAAAPGVSQFQLKTPRRSSVQVKPSNTSTIADSSGMSQTAKRILEALEHFSSPISDAKKIPVKTPGNFAKKRARDEAFDMNSTTRVGLRHLTRELAVPTVPDMLKLKRRQRLQDTTLAARRIISANSGPPPSSSSTAFQMPTENQEYHLRNDNESQKFFGKLRTKSKKKPDIEQPVENVNLPSIALPITSLPSFDIPLPKPSTNLSSISTTSGISSDSSSPSKMRKTESMNSPSDSTTSKRNSFKFSSPIRLEKDVEKNLKSINHFTFSKPIIAESQSTSPKPSLNFISNSNPPATNFMWSGSSTAPRPKTTANKQTESPNKDVKLKTGSCMEILGNKVDKFEESYWECSECFIKNNSNEEICVACKVSKHKASMKKIPSTLGNLLQPSGNENIQFGSEFKMSTDKWECQCCLVRNPVAETKCLSCMAPKQDKKAEKLAETAPKLVPGETVFGKGKFNDSDLEKFKPAKDSWECSGCMLRNPGKVISCPCCNQSKPGLVKISPAKTKEVEEKIETPKLRNNQGFSGFKIEKPANQWECPSCMVRNNSEAAQCVCCSTPCPSTSKTSSSTSTKSQPTTSKIPESGFSGFGDKFKKPAGSWTCDSCMLSNNHEAKECIACGVLKPGATPSTKKLISDSTPKFSFGIPSTSNTPGFTIPESSTAKKTETSKSEAPTNGFTFGIPPSSSQTDQKFTFGIPSANKPQESVGFAFSPPKNVEGLKNEEKAIPATSCGFSFNIPTEVKKIDVNEVTKNKEPTTSSVPLPFGSIPKVSSTPAEETKPVPTFTMPKVENTQTTSTTQSNTVTPNFPTSSPALFTFSAPKPPETEKTSNVLSFGQLPAPMMSQTSSGTTNTLATSAKPTEQLQKNTFGNIPTTIVPSIFGDTTTTTASKSANLNFGSTPTMPDENKSLGFGINKTTNKIPTFGAIENKSSAFGNPSGEKTIFNSPTSIFGAPSPATTTAAPSTIFGVPPTTTTATSTSIFGAPPATTTAATTTPATPAFGWSAGTAIFGTNNGNSGFGTTPTNTGSNIFGNSSTVKPAASVTPAPTPGLFTFGASSSQTSASTPSSSVFSFGASSNTNTPTPINQETPNFGFGNNPAPTPAFGRFGDFGAPQQNANPTQPTPFSFIPPKQNSAPAFGQSAPATNIFDSAQASPANSFSSLTPSSSGGYNFGVQTNTSNIPTAPASSSNPGGFPFSAPPAASRQTGFNFNAPNPATGIEFNFTGGSAPTIFAATPQTAGTRKIKKAVRRIPPRT